MELDPQAIFSAFLVVATMLLVGFPVHEGLHAWTAMKLGDNTARWMGRVTLDPRAHLDQMGALVLGITAVFSAAGGGILFGWAKPTPVNPINMRHGRQGHALVAFAGPASNLVVAAIVAVPLRLIIGNDDWLRSVLSTPVLSMFLDAALLLLSLNILLFIFNLLPVPPLDGWSVLKGIVPQQAARRMSELEIQYANVIPMIFFGLIIIIFLTGGSFLGPLIFGIRDFLLGI
ncbi:MAG: site-2 protease family protein [Candidatus Limnocylindrales bacterium]